MKCVLPDSVISRCNAFVEIFNKIDVQRDMRNIQHNKTWNESETNLLRIIE